MALSIGELTGYLDLDAGPFEKAIGSAFDKLGDKKWQVVGAAAGVAAGTAMAAGLVMSMDAEKGNAKVAAQLDLNKNQAATAGKAAGELFANNYGSSMEDVQGAVSAVMGSISGMKDASSADVQDVTKKVLNLATAFEIDTGRAAQVAGQMVKTGLVDNATEALDLLTGTLQKVPQNVREDIMDAADEYGPFFAQLGIKGSDAMGMLAKASEKGMYGIDKTGDALKEFTIRATDGSKSTEGAMDAIGLNAHDMALQIMAGGKTASSAMGEIINGLTSMDDPAAQAQTALALFGTPLEDLGTDQIPNFLSSIDPMGDAFDDLRGKADQMDATLNGGATNSLESLKRAAQGALMDTMSAAIPYLMPIIDFLKQFAPQIGPAVLVLGALAGIIWAVTAATTAWNAVMALNPVTWIIIGIVALIAAIVLLVMNWDTVVKFLTDVWSGFVGWFQDTTAGLLSWWDGVWSGFVNNGLWSDIAKFTAEAWGNVTRVVTDWATNTLGMFRDFGTNTAGMFADFFSNTVGMFVDFYTNTVGMASDFMAKLAAPIDAGLRIVQTIFATGWEIVQTYVATALAILIAIFTGQFDKIPAYLESAWLKISGFFMSGIAAIDAILGGGITTAVNFAVSTFNTLVAWIAGIPQRFMDGLAALGQLAATVGAWISDAKDTAIRIFLDWVTFVASIPGRIMDGLIALAQLAGTVGAWISSVKDAAVARFLDLVNWVRGLPGMVLAGLAYLGQLAGVVGGYVNSAKDSAVSGFLGLVSWVSGLPGRILSALGSLGSLLSNAGQQIMDGFLNGLKGAFEGVKDFVGGIGQWIADHKGPKAYDLALLIPNGGWIMKSLETGIQRSMPSLKKTLGEVSATIAGGVTGGSVGLTGTASAGAVGSVPGGPSIVYAPTLYGGPDPAEQDRKARVRFNDLLTAYK